jgi:hypothetical protein
VCGDVIGVYEPLLVCGQAQTRSTSLAREPELHDTNDMLLHGSCAARVNRAAHGASAGISAPAPNAAR